MTVNDLWLIFAVCGLVLGLSPNVISVFIGLLAAAFGKGYKKTVVASIALAYIETLLIFYVGFVLILTMLIDNLSNINLDYLGIFTALALVGCGIYNIVFSYLQEQHNDHKRHLSNKAHSLTIKNIGIKTAILGALHTIAKSLTTSLVPLAGVAFILALTNNSKLIIAATTPLAMLAPLILITVLALKKIKLSAIMKWKNDNATTFNAWAGIITVVIGWIICLLISESIKVT